MHPSKQVKFFFNHCFVFFLIGIVCLPLLQANCLQFAFSIQIQLKQYWVVCIREKVLLMNFMLVHKHVVPPLKRTKSVFWLHFLILKSNWPNREKNTGKFLFKSEYHSININHFSHIDKPIKAYHIMSFELKETKLWLTSNMTPS